MNDLLDKFVEDGFCELGNVIDELGCNERFCKKKQIIKKRNLSTYYRFYSI